MQSTTVEEKTLLAKLMAAENITVVHKKAKTAQFNLVTRTLTCPVWKDMDGDLYDLLLGHEISHALHTPPEGWHDVLTSSPKQKAFKYFLNVVEDARIERFLKDKFPGIRKPMMNGYSTLLQRGFFGVSSVENYNEMYLIDKLNLASKLGSLLDIRFKTAEKPFYNRICTVHTWKEVTELAYDLYEYSKKEQKEGEDKNNEEMNKRLMELQEDSEEEDQDQDDDDYGDDEWEVEVMEEGEEGEGKEEEEEREGKEEEGEGKEEEEGEEGKGKEGKEEEKKEGRGKTEGKEKKKSEGGKGGRNRGKEDTETASPGHQNEEDPTDFIPKVKTDEAYRDKQNDLIEANDIEYLDLNIPKVNLQDLLVRCDTVNSGIRTLYTDQMSRTNALDLYNKFKEKNHDYIMLLVKEFEMMKAAKMYKRIKISETGDIDPKKLPFYRLSDDIFRKMARVQAGKSHGLVLILDKSGSMSDHIRGAIEQILILAMFCRKVNIPFIAFTFTNTTGIAKLHDFGEKRVQNGLVPFSMKVNDISLHDIDLREILNSTMNLPKFTESVINQLVIANALGRSEFSPRQFMAPSHEGMGGTPLNEALIGLRDVVKLFKKKHHLSIVNTVIVHDGDADITGGYYREQGIKGHYSPTNSNLQITLHDVKERFSIRLMRGVRKSVTIGLMKWFQMTTGSGIYGFYITNKSQSDLRHSLSNQFYNKEGIKFICMNRTPQEEVIFSKLRQQFIEDKFLESYTPGYSRFFFIHGSDDLTAENPIISDGGKAWTPGRLLTAFMKVGKKQHVSRVLVSKFIRMIAKE